ncbi:MAG: alanine--tRNA ligase [Candidatus Pacebacteria bacterium CG10_big_fil_rev_8_21_14_0_10_56_10]|nr:MAG: alanine--tRNA ligase [Candidatus Pacebacteria bacterium CG10_big_fil_rev_8_21_14_0_10_56_10]
MVTRDHLRQQYLEFFGQRGHAVVPSVSLVPENDPTTLFTGSGMQPMLPYLLGQPHPAGSRIVNSQRCFRAQDIDEVGDNRHTTFFEMLGNWSLSDYFKREQLSWLMELLADELGLKPDRLYVTVFAGNRRLGVPRDDESVQIWQEQFSRRGIEAPTVEDAEQTGLGQGRIFYYDQTKNWWSRAGGPDLMPVGEPGGPDSEVFFDFGEERGFHQRSSFADQPCHPNCDCGRFLEIGNSVFMEYRKQADGSIGELPQRNVDFGGGLERLAAVIDDDPDVFATDFFWPIITELENLSGQKYRAQPARHQPADHHSTEYHHTASFRVMADHVRAAVMLAGDGVFPGSKEQSYFSRRLVRRAIRHARMIGVKGDMFDRLVPVIVSMYSSLRPDLEDRSDQIVAELSEEEAKFRQALDKGLRLIDRLDRLDASTAFKLFESHGFPVELTQEIAQERGQQIDIDEFQVLRQAHADASRTASAGKFKGGLADQNSTTVKYHTATHLLHAALRDVLGDHVRQHGSNITDRRLRFDFSHPQPLTEQQLRRVEQQLNDWIEANLAVTRQEQPYRQAIDEGALAFFGDAYPPTVSVYTIGAGWTDSRTDRPWVSKELCGGPHVETTGRIGRLAITKEQSAGAGIRRLYMELT